MHVAAFTISAYLTKIKHLPKNAAPITEAIMKFAVFVIMHRSVEIVLFIF